MNQRGYAVMLAVGQPALALTLIYHNHPVLHLIGTIELVLIAVVVNAFVIVYSRRNWRANPYGRALMYSKISLAILINLAVLFAFVEPGEWRLALRVLVFTAILVAQARLLHLLFTLRKQTAWDQYISDNKGD